MGDLWWLAVNLKVLDEPSDGVVGVVVSPVVPPVFVSPVGSVFEFPSVTGTSPVVPVPEVSVGVVGSVTGSAGGVSGVLFGSSTEVMADYLAHQVQLDWYRDYQLEFQVSLALQG